MNTHVESDGAAGPGFSAASIIRVTVRIKQRHFVAHLESSSDLNAIPNIVGLWSGCLNRARTGYWELVTALSYLEDWGVNAGPYRDKRMYSFLKRPYRRIIRIRALRRVRYHQN